MKFRVEFISTDEKEVQTSYPYPIPIKSTIKKHNKLDLIIVPGFYLTPSLIKKHTKTASDWINEQFKKGVKIASICTGAVLLAQAGLLNNKTATSHWLLKDYFEKEFPDILFQSNKIIIDHGNIFMSGGATSFQNLLIYIVEKFMGRTVAIGVSKIYLIDINKANQNSYINLAGQKKHNDEIINQIQEYIGTNYRNKFTLAEMTDKFTISERTLIRRFKKATDDTPIQYIQKVKVEKAKEMLENGYKSFEEIAFHLGYEDVNAFRKVFMKLVGIAPMQYRNRYQLTI